MFSYMPAHMMIHVPYDMFVVFVQEVSGYKQHRGKENVLHECEAARHA